LRSSPDEDEELEELAAIIAREDEEIAELAEIVRREDEDTAFG
jgi:hypothetical protein